MGLSRDYEKGKKGTMGDLIDRQAAISAICNACGKIDCDKMDKCEKLQLPPANCSEIPNNSDTIRCKDCKHWDGVDTCDVIDAPVWDNDFCSMAERRSDE